MLLANGAKVCISDVNDAVANNTFDDFKNEFGKEKVHMVVCDVTKKDQFAQHDFNFFRFKFENRSKASDLDIRLILVKLNLV